MGNRHTKASMDSLSTVPPVGTSTGTTLLSSLSASAPISSSPASSSTIAGTAIVAVSSGTSQPKLSSASTIESISSNTASNATSPAIASGPAVPSAPPAAVSNDTTQPISSSASTSAAGPNLDASSTASKDKFIQSTIAGPNGTSLTPSSAPTIATSLSSNTNSDTPSSNATSSTAALLATESTASNGVSPGIVAGIAVGVGIGLALLAVLITCILMRRQHSRNFGNAKQYELTRTNGGESPQQPPSLVVNDYLPQPADDRTVQTKTELLFDQIELFVENYCQVKPGSVAEAVTAELAVFDSPILPSSLASSLLGARDARFIIKHSLARFIIGRISPAAETGDTLLPPHLALLFDATNVNASKAGFSECLSCWRVVTAYIRPNPFTDKLYVADLDRNVDQCVQTFMRAFAPWMDPNFSGQDCVQALTALLEEAAGLGIFLWSQPSEMEFQWATDNQFDSGRLPVTPALVKLTDEHGHKLRQAQVLVRVRPGDVVAS